MVTELAVTNTLVFLKYQAGLPQGGKGVMGPLPPKNFSPFFPLKKGNSKHNKMYTSKS